ncbi:unnamed protein product [Discosporangium mesarthrocarpum]
MICGTDENPTKTLLCDGEGCEGECHLYCLNPPLKRAPRGKWLCLQCDPKKDRRTGRMKGVKASSVENGEVEQGAKHRGEVEGPNGQDIPDPPQESEEDTISVVSGMATEEEGEGAVDETAAMRQAALEVLESSEDSKDGKSAGSVMDDEDTVSEDRPDWQLEEEEDSNSEEVKPTPDIEMDREGMDQGEEEEEEEEEEEDEDDDDVCLVCGSCDRKDALLKCSSCDIGVYHFDCLRPPLREKPEGEWKCPRCSAKGNRRTMAKTTTSKSTEGGRGGPKVVAGKPSASDKIRSPTASAPPSGLGSPIDSQLTKKRKAPLSPDRVAGPISAKRRGPAGGVHREAGRAPGDGAGSGKERSEF